MSMLYFAERSYIAKDLQDIIKRFLQKPLGR